MKRYCDISFCVQGSVKQTLEILDDKWNGVKIVKALNEGIIFTTIQENGTVDIVESGRVVAKIVNVDNSCEYNEFDIDREDYGMKYVENVGLRIVDLENGN